MADEPTLGEVVRRLDDVRQDLKEDIHGVVTLLGGKADSEIVRLGQEAQDERHTTLSGRVAKLEEKDQQKDTQRQNDRRLILFSLVVPVLLLAIQLYTANQGA
ncbi:hypothetical protein PV409_37840 [Streptomyces sp. ME02-6979.5a]|uniref:hypothetical protein n=1 Tax=unclassified Streptomyces TaxID=2593676 RepID=UPI0029BBCA8E|nr:MULTISPECIES: hypothetical protein [unclassified Streptomyces]MDX3343716.1 hypothetical protein [Streptomyces sp. ME02-6979.5a]MDX5526184.1 hypothetical protein [Streptomyces sp. DE06-01C]